MISVQNETRSTSYLLPIFQLETFFHLGNCIICYHANPILVLRWNVCWKLSSRLAFLIPCTGAPIIFSISTLSPPDTALLITVIYSSSDTPAAVMSDSYFYFCSYVATSTSPPVQPVMDTNARPLLCLLVMRLLGIFISFLEVISTLHVERCIQHITFNGTMPLMYNTCGKVSPYRNILYFL